MTTATAIFYGSLTGYIAQLNDGSYRKIKELNRLGCRVSKKLIDTLLNNPITIAWRGKPFITQCPEPMAKIILGTINSGLAGNSGLVRYGSGQENGLKRKYGSRIVKGDTIMGRYTEIYMEFKDRDDLIAFDYHMFQFPEPPKTNARPEYVRPPYAEMTPELMKKIAVLNESDMDFWQKLGECVALNINPEEQIFFKQEMGLCLI